MKSSRLMPAFFLIRITIFTVFSIAMAESKAERHRAERAGFDQEFQSVGCFREREASGEKRLDLAGYGQLGQRTPGFEPLLRRAGIDAEALDAGPDQDHVGQSDRRGSASREA